MVNGIEAVTKENEELIAIISKALPQPIEIKDDYLKNRSDPFSLTLNIKKLIH